MKKLITSFATLALVAGAVANASAFTTMHQNNSTAETAAAIAAKLSNKTIQLNPTIFGGQDIVKKHQQLADAIVAQNILTKDEVQYVSWGGLTINKLVAYPNCDFTVTKDGSTIIAHHITLNAKETSQQLANKLSQATPTFNWTYWQGKDFASNQTLVRSILVNEGILSPLEASYIFLYPYDPPATIDTPNLYYDGQFTVRNDGPEATGEYNFHVIDDGGTVSQVASSLTNAVIQLKTNTVGMYADNSYVEQNVTGFLNNSGQNFNIEKVTLPHQMLKAFGGPPNIVYPTIMKDGQTAVAQSVDLVTQKNPMMQKASNSKTYLRLLVNLTPKCVNACKSYFQSQTNPNLILGYFYNVLNDGEWSDPGSNIPVFPVGTDFGFADTNRLDIEIGRFGYKHDSNVAKASSAARCSVKQNAAFEKALVNQIKNNNGYLSVMFEMYYAGPNNYYINDYGFW